MWLVKHNNVENALASLHYLIHALQLKVSKSEIDRIKHFPNYPSLAAFVDALKEWRVNSLAVKLEPRQLIDIPVPALVHLKKNGGHFVVVEKITETSISYFDSDSGLVTEAIGEFSSRWTGAALLVEATEKSGESNFVEKRKVQRQQVVLRQIAGGISFCLLMLPFALLPVELWVYIIVKVGGLLTCVLLFQRQFHMSNKWASSVCNWGSKSNCDSVIHSPAASFFGISLTEIGLIYFLSSVFYFALVSLYLGFQGVPFLMMAMSITAVVLSPLSIYYQWRIAKAWCPLCLIVVAIVWLEVASLFALNTPISNTMQENALTALALFVPVGVWFSIRQHFIDSLRVVPLENTLLKFTRSSEIFQSLLARQDMVDIGHFEHELELGRSNAPIQIILVTNPTCGPCRLADHVVNDLLSEHSESISVIFRFAIDARKRSDTSYSVANHLVKISLSNSTSLAAAMHGWYLGGAKNGVENWKACFPVESEPSDEFVGRILDRHANWCKQHGITATPTILINGKRIPVEYTISDLRYQISKLV